MFKEINTTVENFQKQDRVEFFWTTFPDGNVINGGSTIIETCKEVSLPAKEWLEQEEWTDDQIKEFENQRKSNKLMLVTVQTDYYEPTTVVMHRDMLVKLYREEKDIK